MALRVVELFSGVGAQRSALDRLGLDCEVTACEIEPHAMRMYDAIHGETPNLGDITKVEHLPPCDLVTWSFPCQDLSVAGERKGMAEGSGTRSALGWEVIRLVRDAVERGEPPRFLLMENVPAILFKTNRPEFERMCRALEEVGYRNDHAVLNAKDYGVPQSRKRCFMVSEFHGKGFTFPEGFPLERRLRDILEPEGAVPAEYYLSEERIARYERHRKRQEENGRNFGWKPVPADGVCNAVTTVPERHASGNMIIVSGSLDEPGRFESACRVHDPEGICPTIPTGAGGGHMPKIEAPADLVVAGDLNNDTTFRRANTVFSADGVAPTITAEHVGINHPKVDRGGEPPEVKVRFLTPRECWRLMGFTDDEIDRAFAVEKSKTWRYRGAGNSIVVDVLVAIFRAMYAVDGGSAPERKSKSRQMRLDEYGE